MAAAKRKKKELKVSPVGIAVYPRVTGSPDTQFDDAGVWKTGLRLSGADAVQLKDDIDAAMERALATAKEANPGKRVKQADPPYSEDEETGDLIVTFKMKASGTREDGTKWERRPKVYDRFGKPIQDAKVGGGSKIQVSYEPSEFYTKLVGAGVSMRLEAVLVRELVEYGSGKAEDFGFDLDDEEETEEAPEGAESDTDDDPDF